MSTQSLSTIYLALGTNLGDRSFNLEKALQSLPPAVSVLKKSPVYETAPWGITDQPLFLNMVIQAEARLSPAKLLKYLKKVEKHMGRVPTVRYGPRLIDVDILFYGDQVIHTPTLTIPHPHLHERAFVLVPLNDIAPNLVHPVLGKTAAILLNDHEVSGVKLYE